MKKYGLLSLIVFNCVLFTMEKSHFKNAIDDIRAIKKENRNPLFMLERFMPFPFFYNFYSTLSTKLYEKDIKNITKYEISTIINLGYQCFCEDKNNTCSQTMDMPCVLGKDLLHFILTKALNSQDKHDFFDVIVNDYKSHYCAFHIILHFLEPYKQFHANYYLTSIIDAASNLLICNPNNSTTGKQICLNGDIRLATYVSILFKNHIDVSFFDIKKGQDKLNSLNGECFPKLKQILESRIK
ncbi:MAG TPA: hypothetical protein VL201_03425 [Patescibacteria group bacterium]|nr:hypothetical protein [Patescibacteria group bacterium]